MALRLLCAAARNWKNYAISNGQAKQFIRPEYTISNLLKIQAPIADSIRSVSFLNKSNLSMENITFIFFHP